jgi:hypothetical protein
MKNSFAALCAQLRVLCGLAFQSKSLLLKRKRSEKFNSRIVHTHRLTVYWLGLSRQSLARDRLHYVAESVQFPERCVNVWRDTDALKLFMNNRRGKDPMLIK